MLTISAIIPIKAKIAASFAAVGLLALADTQVNPASVEDYTLKSALAAAVVFLTRLILRQQAEHKAEMKELRDNHNADMKTVVAANTESNRRVCELAEEQANYFKTVTRNIVDEKLHSHHPVP